MGLSIGRARRWVMAQGRSAQGCIAIERASAQIRVVALRRTDTGVRVSRFAVIEHLQDADTFAAAQLAEVLKAQGFTAKRTVLGLDGEGVTVRLLSLPRLTRRELKMVVEQEIRLESHQPLEELVYDYRSLGTVTEGAVTHELVVSAEVPLARVEYALDFAEKSGAHLTALIPVPFALAALLKFLEPTRTCALLYFIEKTVHVAVSSRGQFRFHRMFPLNSSGTAEQGEVNFEYMTDEVRRSLLYVRQRFRGEKMAALYLCGDRAGHAFQALAPALSSATGLPVEPCTLEGLLDLADLGEEQRTFQALAPKLAMPIGLALAAGEVPNLLPKRLVRRRRAMGRLVAGAVAAGLATLLLLLGVATATARNATLRKQIAAAENELAGLQPRLSQVEQIKKARQDYRARSLLLDQITRHARFPAVLLNSLAEKTPAAVTLHVIEISRGTGGWQLRVDGDIRAGDEAEALTILDRFDKDIHGLPLVMNPAIKLMEEPKPQGLTKEAVQTRKTAFQITAPLALKAVLACGPFSEKA